MLYAIADLHLSLGTDKPMDVFRGWGNYVQRLEDNWRALVKDGDTVVVAGDISWAMGLKQSAADFAFLNGLPGRKILLKGNHDYWWTTRNKMDVFFAAQGFHTLTILHNDAVQIEGVTLCGTRGWLPGEGEDDVKVMAREVGRLKASLDAAKRFGGTPLVFLHYPPRTKSTVCPDIWDVLKAYGIRNCYYGHLHGDGAKNAAVGEVDGVRLHLIAADAVGFSPVAVEMEAAKTEDKGPF
ncbi:MAG: metallophosphoesterase [Oscillospiraceae bacterium]|nr:metallophosphoesterase [Oscillospiraceae bacterium]